MSARKRRVARKIAQLLRMDDTRSRMYSSALLGGPGVRFWNAYMMPLGHKLNRMGYRDRAIEALELRRRWRVSHGGKP
ncbi:hypothetical protein FEE59_13575 [Herbaspirillum sp. RU 5E]|nr:hypothetical protein [Herbaspirillum sp. RU 5E]